MVERVAPETVKAWLSDGDEIAFFDVREYGQYGESHPFFGVPLAYSVFESRVGALTPNRAVRMVLYDDGDGIAELAAGRAEALGYTNVSVMEGGAPAWGKAGFTLYAGVNVPSKTFGELLEIACHTPRKSAREVADIQASGANHVIVDGRPFAEYNQFNIPGGICCPNGEMALRIGEIAPDPETTIIVNCAGRTRSILGAQTLIDFGVPNPVYALENGTQGWFLEGLEQEYGADRSYPEAPGSETRAALSERAQARARATGVGFVSAAQAAEWLADGSRTTYLLDVRTAEEFEADGVPASSHAPGGQLVQATDQWIGVRGARVLLLDDDLVRAPMVGHWLHQLGHDVSVIEGGISAMKDVPARAGVAPASTVPTISSAELKARRDAGPVQLLDIRSSADYRAAHIAGARWTIRPRLQDLGIADGADVVFVGAPAVAGLAAQRLGGLVTPSSVSCLDGTPDDWRAAGLEVVETPDDPSDAERIDFLFFTHERRTSEAASRQYLAWEIGLVDQLDKQERASFRIAAEAAV